MPLLTSQEIKDRLFLFNVTNDYSYVLNTHPLQQVNFMYPEVILPFDILMEKSPEIKKAKKLQHLKYIFEPSDSAIAKLN